MYPDRAELDVVRLVDGTVLKGVILEQVPERYVEIELFGGSTFVLGYEQIESVEREANPDYGTTWIKIDLGALDAAGGTSGDVGQDAADIRDETRDSGPRPLSAGGHLVSAYSFGMIPVFVDVPIDMGGWTGDDWDNLLSDLELDRSAQIEAGGGTAGFGLSYTRWKPLERVEGDLWIWGARGSLGFHHIGSGHIEEDGRSVEPRNVYVTVQANHIPVIAEGLVGIAGERAAVFVGAGVGLGLINYTRADYSLWYSEESGILKNVDVDGELTITEEVTPLYSASLTGLFRLGRRWVLEAGLWANGQFVSAFEEGFVFRGWGERIAIGYRFGGK
ncbi:MAG: hypothetical protein PF508_16700 [Spirochaeta sp.]|nr:hypothetical protein [Spirochaeta sp.]